MSDVWTSQVIKEELYGYTMAKFTDNWRGITRIFFVSRNCKASSIYVTASIIPCKVKVTHVMVSEI